MAEVGAGQVTAVSPLQHFWSLSVEEQFYVVWPLLIIAGTWLAVRDGLVGRPLGWAIDMTPLSGFVFGLGTALSGPLVLLVALVAANLRLRLDEGAEQRAAGWIAILGAGFLGGMLAEPILWDVFEPGVGSLEAATMIANVTAAPIFHHDTGARPVARPV